jgi:DNA mismatch endonuclease, patch repair protein
MMQLNTSRARSKNMAAIRQHGTVPEQRVRKVLNDLRIRYRTNVRSLPGSPDIANRKQGFAILVHGCYWHRHQGCHRASLPKTNADFWKAKLRANVVRDRGVLRKLAGAGLHTLVIWECETRDEKRLRKKVNQFVNSYGLRPSKQIAARRVDFPIIL